jgi:multidrug efflux pump
MNLSTPFIHRPVGTTLLTIAMTLAGAIGYFLLPVSPLPQVDFPTIQISASLPGASPETMASSVATPLERQFGQIAGVTEMTSTCYLGSCSITLQFELNRNIDAAARDVQAAINSARGRLPANLPNNPTYRKVNPSDSPVMILALTSETYSRPQMYDAAQTILQQKLSQVQGVGQVNVGGGSPTAVRVNVNPTVLNQFGISFEQLRQALFNANANRPKGQLSNDEHSWTISTTDQLLSAKEYRPLIVAYRNGSPVRLADVAKVEDSVEDVRALGLANGKPSISVMVFRQPGENIIATVDRVHELLPVLRSQIPAGINLEVIMDRTATIRASVKEVQFSLVLSVVLVILVVFVFLRDARATFIPSVAVPVSLVSTFGVMYLCDYSIDNLSLMALTIATGFVVDDAIVVVENIARHLEDGVPPLRAAILGACEIGFTVLSISISLIAVFIPILLMGGTIGRLFREFAVTLSVSIVISLFVSLTMTPMLCAVMLKPHQEQRRGPIFRFTEGVLNWILKLYEHSLIWVLKHQGFTLIVTLATLVFTVYLYVIIPKGFLPQQDTGRLIGQITADQDTSFQKMSVLLERFAATVGQDPAVAAVTVFTGGGGGGGSGAANVSRMFVSLKPLRERQKSAEEVIARIRIETAKIAGASLSLTSSQDLRFTARSSSAQYQYTIRGDNLDDLNTWGPILLRELRKQPTLVDVSSDQQNRGLQASLNIDRDAAARLGITPQDIDNTLYDAFGQRQVSTMYKSLNQYRVVLAVEPDFWQNPDALKHIYIPAANGKQIPLAALQQTTPRNTPLSVNHSGLFPSATISFSLPPGSSLGDAVQLVEDISLDLGLPETIHGSFQGTAQMYRASLDNQPLLILAALVAMYIVLGMLYESYIHPITILSTLPSAGVGALLALMICGTQLNVMALIGILLLIGIVKKNAIMMIDFALEAERTHGRAPEAAIFEACLLRFRPITMTTMAALLGGLPLAMGQGDGAELRQPLGIAIVGGLIFSQVLTLYTTPVVYLYLDRLRSGVATRREPVELQVTTY